MSTTSSDESFVVVDIDDETMDNEATTNHVTVNRSTIVQPNRLQTLTPPYIASSVATHQPASVPFYANPYAYQPYIGAPVAFQPYISQAYPNQASSFNYQPTQFLPHTNPSTVGYLSANQSTASASTVKHAAVSHPTGGQTTGTTLTVQAQPNAFFRLPPAARNQILDLLCSSAITYSYVGSNQWCANAYWPEGPYVPLLSRSQLSRPEDWYSRVEFTPPMELSLVNRQMKLEAEAAVVRNNAGGYLYML